MSIRKDMKLGCALLNVTRKCKCGHSITFTNPRTLQVCCSWCGRMVYKDDKTAFVLKLQNKLKKIERLKI